MSKRGISVIGCIIVDQGYEVPKYPRKGNLAYLSNPTYHTGGINNIAMDLARLDETLPIYIGGVMGKDSTGKKVLKAYEKFPNVNLDGVIRRGKTAITYAISEKESRQRTFFSYMGASTSYNISDIDFDEMSAEFVVVDYILALGKLDEPNEKYGTNIGEVLNEFQKRGTKTVVDVVSEESDRYIEIVRPTLPYADYYFSNEVEASGVIGFDIYDDNGIIDEKAYKAMEDIAGFGVSTWVVIHSPKATYAYDVKKKTAVKVISEELPKGYIKGTTGAGDALAGGVVYGAYIGLDLQKAVELGMKVAALSLSKEDSNSGVIPYKKIF